VREWLVFRLNRPNEGIIADEALRARALSTSAAGPWLCGARRKGVVIGTARASAAITGSCTIRKRTSRQNSPR